jgi:hypothetical protein
MISSKAAGINDHAGRDGAATVLPFFDDHCVRKLDKQTLDGVCDEC